MRHPFNLYISLLKVSFCHWNTNVSFEKELEGEQWLLHGYCIVIRLNSMAFVCGEQLFIGPLQSKWCTANLANIDWHTFIALQSCERGVLGRCHQPFCAFKLALGKLKLDITPCFFFNLSYLQFLKFCHLRPSWMSTVYPCLLLFLLGKFWFILSRGSLWSCCGGVGGSCRLSCVWWSSEMRRQIPSVCVDFIFNPV